MRGQFRGYRAEPGVAAGSQIGTFAALRLAVNSWRWHAEEKLLGESVELLATHHPAAGETDAYERVLGGPPPGG